MPPLKGLLHRARDRVIKALYGATALKERSELAYWRRRQRVEDVLANDHFRWFFTAHFGLEDGFYAGKRLLDVGCGPRGSLEWAARAAARVGVDPLALSYRTLGTARHAMRYVASPAERLPFPDGAFDVVSCFNALDHVADLDRTIAELTRVVAPDGRLLLLVEVDHPPTPCEPVTFSWDVLDRFRPAFTVVREDRYENHPSGVYDAIREDRRYDAADPVVRPAWLSAHLRRLTPGGRRAAG